jgi:hypothetical protein
MAHPYHHAVRSARLFGGKPEDYLALHDWFDESKAHLADFRHRALRHHSEGIFLCASIFGATIGNSDGKHVPVRTIGEQHVTDDLGWIPPVKDWLQHIQPQPWMGRTPFRPQTDAAATKTNAVHLNNSMPAETRSSILTSAVELVRSAAAFVARRSLAPSGHLSPQPIQQRSGVKRT